MLSEYFILFLSFLLYCFPLTCYEVKKDKEWKKPKIVKININILYGAGLIGSSLVFMELVNELNIGNLIIISIALAVILGILIRIKVKLKNQTFHEEIIRKVKVRIFLHECKKK